MIKIKELKQLLEQYPDDALAYAYEGEQVGIAIVGALGKNSLIHENLGFILASEHNPEYLKRLRKLYVSLGMNQMR